MNFYYISILKKNGKKKYHTGATVPISDRKSVEIGKFDFKTHNYTTVHFPALVQTP